VGRAPEGETRRPVAVFKLKDNESQEETNCNKAKNDRFAQKRRLNACNTARKGLKSKGATQHWGGCDFQKRKSQPVVKYPHRESLIRKIIEQCQIISKTR
jgi:hypothetical protein